MSLTPLIRSSPLIQTGPLSGLVVGLSFPPSRACFFRPLVLVARRSGCLKDAASERRPVGEGGQAGFIATRRNVSARTHATQQTG